MARRSNTINTRLQIGCGRTPLLLFGCVCYDPGSTRASPNVTDVHQLLGILVLAASVALLVAGGWSAIATRRSGGARDHRFAVDRLVLVVLALVLTNGLVGLLLIGTGGRPADPLHLLYGPVAVATLPVGVWLSRRVSAGAVATRRREAWLIAATVVLLGIELRLFATG
jgi:hypothetical protein